MLAALLENNNNARQQPTFKVDPRASGGRSRHNIIDGGGEQPQRYNIVDIIAAAAAFPEIVGEDPVTRTARRHRWISEALPYIKEAREKREAAAFLAGARLADAAAEERHAAQDQLKIEQIIEIIDEVRATTTPAVQTLPIPRSQALMRGPHERGGRSPGGHGFGLFVGGLVVGGLLVGLALRKRTPQRQGR